MNKAEFFSRLAEAFPDELYCNALEISFQVPSKEAFGETVKRTTEVIKQLGKDWHCEPTIAINPTFLSITVEFKT